jgi:hypothetical protein
MSHSMKSRISISFALCLLAGRLFGQAAPSVTEVSSATPAGASAPRLSWVDGTIHYAVSGAELIQYGYYGAGAVTSSTSLSGILGYSSMSQVHPTDLLVSTGILFGQGGQGTAPYENAAISQSYIRGKWVLNGSDSFSFLPQSPVSGISGVPGIGFSGTSPIDGPGEGPAGGILTYSGNRISNMLSGTVERKLTGRTSISGNGSWLLLHFLDRDAGLDNTSTTGQLAINHILDPRDTVSVAAVYSTFNSTNIAGLFPPGFPFDEVTYQTKGITGSFSRQWTRSFSTTASGGPMWIQSSAKPLIPNRLNFSLSGTGSYTRRLTTYGASYLHGINGGSGVQPGAISDTVTGFVVHTFNEKWQASSSMVYSRSSGIASLVPGGPTGSTTTTFGTVQVSRGFRRTLSGYVSYTGQNQDLGQGFITANAFNGTSHVVGIGVTWAPQATRVGEF